MESSYQRIEVIQSKYLECLYPGEWSRLSEPTKAKETWLIDPKKTTEYPNTELKVRTQNYCAYVIGGYCQELIEPLSRQLELAEYGHLESLLSIVLSWRKGQRGMDRKIQDRRRG